MADSKEPRKETVRITLPPRAQKPVATSGPSPRDTVRIHLPARPPGNGTAASTDRPTPVTPPPGAAPLRPPSSQPHLPPNTPTSFAPASPVKNTPPIIGAGGGGPSPAPAIPEPSASSVAGRQPTVPAGSGPKKETARITVLPDPPARAGGSVQMKKTQPLSTLPDPAAPAAAVHMTPGPKMVASRADAIPMWLCWTLVGISAAVLIVQIWSYLK